MHITAPKRDVVEFCTTYGKVDLGEGVVDCNLVSVETIVGGGCHINLRSSQPNSKSIEVTSRST